MASGRTVLANEGFYPPSFGQPARLQMPGNIQFGAQQMQYPQSQMPLPNQQQPMSGPGMPTVDPRFAPSYGQAQYGAPSPYGTPMPLPQTGMPMQASAPMMPQQPPVKMQIADGSSPVDLVIENIRFSEPGTLLVGPSYIVKVSNKGSEYAPCFHIGLFASLDGVVNQQTSKALLEARDLAPGSSVEYTIRLPVNADSNFDPMTRQIRPFTHIAAAVDVFRVQPEGDESNNTAILPRVVVDNAE